MPEEFEGDLAGAVFWGADLTDARFRDVNLTGAKFSHSWLVNIEIDALVDNFVVNGVDVTNYVNERDPWHPLRAMLTPATPEETRATWSALETEWMKTIGVAQAIPEAKAQESVTNEFSFVETVRHLVFAMDKWFTAPILGEDFHPIGLPNKGSLSVGWPNLDYTLRPTLTEALAVRADRAQRFRDFVSSVTAADLERRVDVIENGPHELKQCLHTVFEEEFWHNRYALRDLAQLH